ncbi:MAG: serine hydrolase [Clostridiales bacterium]|nr:serine hydrolase [Clostridiales bacterium]
MSLCPFSIDSYVFGSEWRRDEIAAVTFLDTLEGEPEDSWDVSGEKNGTVKAWVQEVDGLRTLCIAADGTVSLPEDSSLLFAGYCYATGMDLSGVDTSGVTNMSYMFGGCVCLEKLDISSFDTSGVTDMKSMFEDYRALTELDVSGFDTSAVTDMSEMFRGCAGLGELDVSGFDMTGAITTDMFGENETETSETDEDGAGAEETETPETDEDTAETAGATQEEGMLSPSSGDSLFSSFSSGTDSNLETLLSQVQAMLPTNNGSWSVYVCDLATGSQGSVNNSSMQAASLIKLFIMGAVYENYDGLSAQYGSSTLDSYLYSMITVSDNDAANALVSCLGGGSSSGGMAVVNQFCQSHGYTGTSMGRLLLASKENGDNYTSAEDCGNFLREVYQINAGTAQGATLSHADSMFSLLKQQTRRNKIPASMPSGVGVANKTGELSDVENDAGIIYNTENDLIIVFMSENLSAAGSAQSEIAEDSRFIYDYYNG